MKDTLASVFGLFCFLGGFMLCYWIINRVKTRLLDVPKTDITVQDISEWIKKDRQARELLAVAKQSREKFIAEQR